MPIDRGTQKKSAALGMSFTTANYRLKKLVMFNILCKYGENICFRCEMPIVDINTLTIEHKLPWLDVDPALFWDMDNIAFSHFSCNSRAARSSTQPRILKIQRSRMIGPSGTAWCHGHRDFLPIGKFRNNSYNWNGLQGECQDCRKRNPSRKSQKLERVTGNDPATFRVAL